LADALGDPAVVPVEHDAEDVTAPQLVERGMDLSL
jgi:hypothetical protein